MQYTDQKGRRESYRMPSRWHVFALLMVNLFTGCVSPWEKSALLKDSYPNIEKVQGPTERRLRGSLWRRKIEEPDESDSLKPIAGTDDYMAATELYNDEKYPEAQAAFKKVAKKYKKSEIREDALFMQAEAAFQREHYSKAHDLYAVLLKEYPSTRHLDVVSERLFKIGRIWLDFPEVAKLGEIKQVNLDNPDRRLPAEEPPKLNKTPVFVPNMSDKKRPLFDTPGNGVAALQAIWMNDPTGPLADDAMMLVASHHARRGSYVEADRYFRMLRETFPHSPHLQDAFLLGSHVKLMSYQGADYDGKALSDAEQLKRSTINLYPESPEAGRLRSELARIQEAKAEREWKQIEFWNKKKNKRATCVMCHLLIDHFPDSPYAEKARAQLEQMGPEYVSGAVLLTPVDPKKPNLLVQIFPGLQPRNQTSTVRPAISPETPSKAKEEQPAPRWLPGNPFRKKPDPSQDSMEPPETDHPVDEGPERVASGTKPEDKASAKKRSWLWPAPKRLPDDTDENATKLDPDKQDPGRADLNSR